MKNAPSAEKTILKRNALTVECFFAGNGKLERKIERYGPRFIEYAYQYDDKGRLTKTRRDNDVTEQYAYNASGQRIEQKRACRGFSDAACGMLFYDEEGRLRRRGRRRFPMTSAALFPSAAIAGE